MHADRGRRRGCERPSRRDQIYSPPSCRKLLARAFHVDNFTAFVSSSTCNHILLFRIPRPYTSTLSFPFISRFAFSYLHFAVCSLPFFPPHIPFSSTSTDLPHQPINSQQRMANAIASSSQAVKRSSPNATGPSSAKRARQSSTKHDDFDDDEDIDEDGAELDQSAKAKAERKAARVSVLRQSPTLQPLTIACNRSFATENQHSARVTNANSTLHGSNHESSSWSERIALYGLATPLRFRQARQLEKALLRKASLRSPAILVFHPR